MTPHTITTGEIYISLFQAVNVTTTACALMERNATTACAGEAVRLLQKYFLDLIGNCKLQIVVTANTANRANRDDIQYFLSRIQYSLLILLFQSTNVDVVQKELIQRERASIELLEVVHQIRLVSNYFNQTYIKRNKIYLVRLKESIMGQLKV